MTAGRMLAFAVTVAIVVAIDSQLGHYISDVLGQYMAVLNAAVGAPS